MILNNTSATTLTCGQPCVYADVSDCTIHFSDGTEVVCKPQETDNFVVINCLPVHEEKTFFRKQVLKHYPQCRSVSELAHQCGYTQLRTFTRHFKKYMGERKTPYQWMLSRKENELLAYLTQTDMNVEDIMQLFRLSSYTYLYSFCKKRLGLSPYELRKARSDKQTTQAITV